MPYITPLHSLYTEKGMGKVKNVPHQMSSLPQSISIVSAMSYMGPQGYVRKPVSSQLILALANTFHEFFEEKSLPQSEKKCAQVTRSFK